MTSVAQTFALEQWYTTAHGRAVMHEEVALIQQQLVNCFGYHLLLIEGGAHAVRLGESPIRHRIITSSGNSIDRGLVCQMEALPIASESIDLVVLPHSLEWCQEPHQLLREVDRVLIHDGKVLILGFNPWSPWGWRAGIERLLQRGGSPAPWGQRQLSAHRVCDWLALLGLDTMAQVSYLYHPPLSWFDGVKWAAMQSWCAYHCPRVGGGYLILAQKRLSTLTPIRLKWRRSIGTVGLNSPAVRRQTERK